MVVLRILDESLEGVMQSVLGTVDHVIIGRLEKGRKFRVFFTGPVDSPLAETHNGGGNCIKQVDLIIANIGELSIPAI